MHMYEHLTVATDTAVVGSELRALMDERIMLYASVFYTSALKGNIAVLLFTGCSAVRPGLYGLHR